MHLPAEHVLPVSQSVLNLHAALQTFRAGVVNVAACRLHILLVHSAADAHAAPFAFKPAPVCASVAVLVFVSRNGTEIALNVGMRSFGDVSRLDASVPVSQAPVAVLHVFPAPHWLFKVHGAQVFVTIGAAAALVVLQYPLAQSAFAVQVSSLPNGPAGGVSGAVGCSHPALQFARHVSQASAVCPPVCGGGV